LRGLGSAPLLFQGPECTTSSSKFIYQDQQIRNNSSSNIIIPFTNKDYKIVNSKNKLLYQGKMKDGLKHGFGKEFFQSGKISYEGSFKNGVYHGDNSSIYFYLGGIYFKGKMIDGKKQGHGTLYNKSGSKTIKYEGNFQDDHPHGTYCLNYNDQGLIEYVGGYQLGLKDGEDCTDYYSNGLIAYQGGYKVGKKHGDICVKYYDNGNI